MMIGNRRLRLQFERAPDDGHNSARNMLSSVYATKQSILQLIYLIYFIQQLIIASGWAFYLNYVYPFAISTLVFLFYPPYYHPSFFSCLPKEF
jgi:hypothetical protein